MPAKLKGAYVGAAWYQRVVPIPKTRTRQQVWLKIGGVNTPDNSIYGTFLWLGGIGIFHDRSRLKARATSGPGDIEVDYARHRRELRHGLVGVGDDPFTFAHEAAHQLCQVLVGFRQRERLRERNPVFSGFLRFVLIQSVMGVTPDSSDRMTSRAFYKRLVDTGLALLSKETNLPFPAALLNPLRIMARQAGLALNNALLGEELKQAQIETVYRLGLAAEVRDQETGLHLLRVSHYAQILARSQGQSAEFQDLVFRAAPLHDVGKIGIPDSILLKAGPLTEAERTVVKTHTTLGHQILSAWPEVLDIARRFRA